MGTELKGTKDLHEPVEEAVSVRLVQTVKGKHLLCEVLLPLYLPYLITIEVETQIEDI